MDKISFLAVLADKLSHYPLSNEEVESQVSSMSRYLATVSDEEFESENAGEQDAEEIASNIYKKFYQNKQKAEEFSADSESADNGDNVKNPDAVSIQEEKSDKSEQEPDILEELALEAQREREEQQRIEELKQKAIELAREDMRAKTDELADEEKAEISNDAFEAQKTIETTAEVDDNSQELSLSEPEITSSEKNDEYDPIDSAFDPSEEPDRAFEEAEATRIFSTGETAKAIVDYDLAESENDFINNKKLKKVDKKKKKHMKESRHNVNDIKGTPAFWALFILTLPITTPLAIVVCVLFGLAYILLTAVIVALALAMVCTVAFGTALALIGIIYGATKCISSTPIGIFEIGFGIAVGGVTMLLALLLYNAAIRFAPRLYKYITEFAKFVFSKISELYYTLKKECGR